MNTVSHLKNAALAALLSGVFAMPVGAHSGDVCVHSQDLLDGVHDKLSNWVGTERVRRLDLLRVMVGANLVRDHVREEGLAEELHEALNALVIARDSGDPRADVYSNILIVAGHMPDLCPNVIVPDFSTYSNFAPE